MVELAQAKTPQDTLREWLKSVAVDRDETAFKMLFDHYVPLLRSYSLAREPGSALLADELAQEVMIKVWNKAASYNADKANTNTWIFTLARNSRIDYLRRNGRFATNIDSTDLFDNIVDTSPSPFQAAQTQTVQKNIRQGLDQLPNEQAEILRKVYLQGRSHQQASDELNLPLGTVKSRVRLALKKMQLLMGDL
jgi:RNA polymerase sigma-70 factor (ECF subfamily)